MKIRLTSAHSRRDVLKAIGAATAVGASPFAGRMAAASEKLKIGMIGSGNVGSALGTVSDMGVSPTGPARTPGLTGSESYFTAAMRSI